MMSKYYTEEELEMLEHFETLMNNRPERVYCDAEYYGEREFEWTKGTWHIYSSNLFYNFSTVEYVRGDLFKELEVKLAKAVEIAKLFSGGLDGNIIGDEERKAMEELEELTGGKDV